MFMPWFVGGLSVGTQQNYSDAFGWIFFWNIFGCYRALWFWSSEHRLDFWDNPDARLFTLRGNWCILPKYVVNCWSVCAWYSNPWWMYLLSTIGVARLFSGGCTFLDQKSDDLFFSDRLLFHAHMRHILPPPTFISHLQGCTSPTSAPFLPHFNKKCLENFFSVALWVHLHPLHPPWLRLCWVHNKTFFKVSREAHWCSWQHLVKRSLLWPPQTLHN